MYDVAYVLSELNREGTDLLSNLVERDAFRRRYEQGTGIEIDDEACGYYQRALRDALGGVLDERHRAVRQRAATTTCAWPARRGRSPSCSTHAARALGY